MGDNVYFACSARSPILTSVEPGYVLRDAISFISPENDQLQIFIYNLKNQGYDEIFWFLERDLPEIFKEKIAHNFYSGGVKMTNFIVLNTLKNVGFVV